MPYTELAETLQSRLALELPPIALARVAESPAGVSRLGAAAPSACTFWRRAEREVFYATAEDHFNCPIGAMVMGFPLPEAKSKELMGLVEQMCALNYISMEEVPNIPAFREPAAGVVYGPLADFPIEPEVALLWTTPVEAMLFEEAAGATAWTAQAAAAVFGRPGCSALPMAVSRGQVVTSLGCAGMRTYTGIPDDRFLVAIPGNRLPALNEALTRTLTANRHMREFYAGQKAKFPD